LNIQLKSSATILHLWNIINKPITSYKINMCIIIKLPQFIYNNIRKRIKAINQIKITSSKNNYCNTQERIIRRVSAHTNNFKKKKSFQGTRAPIWYTNSMKMNIYPISRIIKEITQVILHNLLKKNNQYQICTDSRSSKMKESYMTRLVLISIIPITNLILKQLKN